MIILVPLVLAGLFLALIILLPELPHPIVAAFIVCMMVAGILRLKTIMKI